MERQVPAVKPGYLEKLGEKYILQSITTKAGWKKRWFELHGKKLIYYRKTPGLKTQQGEIDLDSKTVIAPIHALNVGRKDSKYEGCAFSIKTPNREYSLCADSVASMKSWVEQLNAVLYAYYPDTVSI